VYSKFLAAKTAHYRAVNYRSAQILVGYFSIARVDALSGQVSDEAAGEAIARAGGIEHLLQQVAGDHEMAVLAEQNGAELAPLDDQRVRAHTQNLRSGAAQVVLAGEHARFAVVDQQEIPFGDGLQQLVAMIGDPVIHRIASHQAQSVHLRADGSLQLGLDISEQQVRLRAVGGRELGLEVGED